MPIAAYEKKCWAFTLLRGKVAVAAETICMMTASSEQACRNEGPWPKAVKEGALKWACKASSKLASWAGVEPT